MAQRSIKIPIQDQLQNCYTSLSSFITTLEQLDMRNTSPMTCAEIALEHLNVNEDVVFSSRLMQQQFEKIRHPFTAPLGAIISKAQNFYYESIVYDLNRLKNEERITELTKIDLKQCIEEINWRVLMNDQQALLNESQQIQENAQIMKFFQGVRNYQNKQEALQKQCIQKLKDYAATVERQIYLKKGFYISKSIDTLQGYLSENMRQLFKISKQQTKRQKALRILHDFYRNTFRNSLERIYQTSKKISPKQKLANMINKKLNTQSHRYMLPVAKQILKLNFKLKKFTQIIHGIIKIKKIAVSNKFFKKINHSFARKIAGTNNNFAKLSYILKKFAFHTFTKATKVNQLNFTALLVKRIRDYHQQIFKETVYSILNSRPKRPPVSQKIKARIILSLQKYQCKPRNLRTTFYQWYLRGNEDKFSKQIYNIWLKGNINKLTFFLRLKNLITENRKMVIKYELKLFLIVLCDKYTKFQDLYKKIYFNKWLQKKRSLKKKDENKAQAKRLMHQIIYSIEQKTANAKKASIQIFEKNKLLADDKIAKLFMKAFQYDKIYQQRYFDRWRNNKDFINFQQIQAQNQENARKARAIKGIAEILRRTKQNVKLETVGNFCNLANAKKLRQMKIKQKLSCFLRKNQQATSKQFINILEKQMEVAFQKKDTCVKKLVFVNSIKQKQTIQLWTQKAEQLKNMAKMETTKKSYEILNQVIEHTNLTFVKDRIISRVLLKIVLNRKQNIKDTLKLFNNLPPRMIWTYRQNCVRLAEKLHHMVLTNQNATFQMFKRSLLEGEFKKKRSLMILITKIQDATKLYFQKYRKNVNQQKIIQKAEAIDNFMMKMQNVNFSNFETLFKNEHQWKVKAKFLNMMFAKLTKKMEHAFYIWHETAKGISHYQNIQNQKKRRCLQLLKKVLQSKQYSNSKKMIEQFRKNFVIINIQKKFLNKLLDTQVGKVSKVFTIMKNLPQPKDPVLMAKSYRFYSNLERLVKKRFKETLNCFEDQYFTGNDKKKNIVRLIVSKYSMEFKGYFQKWKKANQLSKLFDKNRRIQQLLKVSQQKYRLNSFDILLSGNQSKIAERCIKKLIQTCEINQKLVFQIWRKRVQGFRIKDVKKKHALMTIAALLRRNQSENRKDKIKHMVFESHKVVIMKNFIQHHFVNEKRRTIRDAIYKMKDLPDWKRRNKKLSLAHALDIAEKNKTSLNKQAFGIFNYIHYKGQFRKQQFLGTFIKSQVNQISKILEQWNDMVKDEKQDNKKKSLSDFFTCLDENNRSNFQMIFTNHKQIQLKKKTIDKLIRAQQIRMKGYIQLWHKNIQDMKMAEKIDKSTKSLVIDRLTKIVQSSSTLGIKKAVRAFNQNFRIKDVQKKFISKLLSTKSGKVLEAFGKWKDIPNQNLMENYRKAQKFYYKLEGLVKQKLAFTYSAFSINYEQGNTMKKQVVLRMFQTTSSGIRKYYNRWSNITKKDLTVKNVRQTMHFMDILQNVTANQFLIVFQDQRSYQVKVKAIQRLILACGEGIKSYFELWRNKVKQLKLNQSMGIEKKKNALQFFNRVIGNSTNQQILNTIYKFKKNHHIGQISRNFFNKLLMTKSGKVIKGFEMWKSIPDAKIAKKKKQAILFESKLLKYMQKHVRNAWTPFKDKSFEAMNKKRYCLERLIRLSQSDIRTKYDKWRTVNRQAKLLQNAKSLQYFFSQTSSMTKQNIAPLVKDTKQQIGKKLNLCRKLVQNSNFVVHHAYMVWKQAYQIDNTKIAKQQQRVRIILRNFIGVRQNCDRKNSVEAIHKFQSLLIKKQEEEAIEQQQYKNRDTLVIANTLQQLFAKKMSSFFRQLNNSQLQETMISRVKGIEQSFSVMQQLLLNNWTMVLRTNKESVIIQKALIKLFSNFSTNLQRAFNIWRQNKNIIGIQANITKEKKKNIITILSKALNSQQDKQIPQVIKQFQKNYKIIKLQKQILSKILQTKAGKMPLAFMMWKGLPDPGAKKLKVQAMKFQAGLAKFANSKLKKVFEYFKDEQYEGNNKKKLAIRKIFSATMSDSNRMFSKWKKVVGQTKITEKITSLDNAAIIMQKINQQQLGLLFDNFKQQSKLRQKLVRNLFKNIANNLGDSLNIWRENIKQYKATTLIKAIERISENNINERLQRQCFEIIRKKSQMDKMSNYINGLWRWKTSNLQANYYSKFIKFLEESQQMLIFSQLFNRKMYEYMHFAFRKILQEGTFRNQRKKQLVQKFMKKKLNHYFQTLRNNILHNEVETWRGQFQNTIKGNVLGQKIAKIIIRKQLAYFFNLLIQYKGTSIMLQKFENKLQNYRSKLKRAAFLKLNNYAIVHFVDILNNLFTNKKTQMKDHVFSILFIWQKICRLQQIIQRTVQKQSLRYSLQKIHARGQKATRCKLALILLSGIQQQKTQEKLRRVIGPFRRNMENVHIIEKIGHALTSKMNDSQREFFQIYRETQKKEQLLDYFNKGTKIFGIFKKQDRKLMQIYFQKMKKKQNPWLKKAILCFASKSQIKSTPAIALWRMKLYAQSLKQQL